MTDEKIANCWRNYGTYVWDRRAGYGRDNKLSQGTDGKTQYALRRRWPADESSAAGSAVAGSGSAILDSRIRYLPRNAVLRHSRYGIHAPADRWYRFARQQLLSQTPHYSLWLWGWSSPLSRSDIIRQHTITQTAAAFLPPRSTCTPQPAERFLFYSAPERQIPRSLHHSHISATTWSPLTTRSSLRSAGGSKHFAAIECASCSLYYSLTVNFFFISRTGKFLVRTISWSTRGANTGNRTCALRYRAALLSARQLLLESVSGVQTLGAPKLKIKFYDFSHYWTMPCINTDSDFRRNLWRINPCFFLIIMEKQSILQLLEFIR